VFFLRNKAGEIEFTLVAEGIRKLALLWLLVTNGVLDKEATLYWDEPETNLNPSMIPLVVEVILELEKLGVDYICVHTASDVKSTKAPPLKELQAVKKVTKRTKIAIAGGIDADSIGNIVKENPEIIIVGSWITKNAERREAALLIKKIMNFR